MKLYNICILPMFLYILECSAIIKADACRINALHLSMLPGIKRYHFVSNDEVQNRINQPALHWNHSGTAFDLVWADHLNGWQNRRQADSNFVITCRLEETSGATSYYVDENSSKWKERSQQMQTLHTGCSKVEP